jgi:hypothetical protein
MDFLDDLPLTEILWSVAGALFVIAAFAASAERRRAARPNLDKAGVMPWHLIQILAFIGAIAAGALALKA